MARKHASMEASYNLRFCCWPSLSCLLSFFFFAELILNPLKLYGTVLLKDFLLFIGQKSDLAILLLYELVDKSS